MQQELPDVRIGECIIYFQIIPVEETQGRRHSRSVLISSLTFSVHPSMRSKVRRLVAGSCGIQPGAGRRLLEPIRGLWRRIIAPRRSFGVPKDFSTIRQTSSPRDA